MGTTKTRITQEHLDALQWCISTVEVKRDELQRTLDGLHADGNHRHDRTYQPIINHNAEHVRLGNEALAAVVSLIERGPWGAA